MIVQLNKPLQLQSLNSHKVGDISEASSVRGSCDLYGTEHSSPNQLKNQTMRMS